MNVKVRELLRESLAVNVDYKALVADYAVLVDGYDARVESLEAALREIRALAARWRLDYEGLVSGDYDRGYKNARGLDCPEELEAILAHAALTPQEPTGCARCGDSRRRAGKPCQHPSCPGYELPAQEPKCPDCGGEGVLPATGIVRLLTRQCVVPCPSCTGGD